MDLNLMMAGRAHANPDGTYNAEGLTMNTVLRDPRDGGGYLADALVAITWAPDDVGDHTVVLEVRGARGAVLQREARAFHIKPGTHGYGVHVEKFVARLPYDEALVRINASIGRAARSWPMRVDGPKRRPGSAGG